jgi:hypothetical protein
VVKAPVELLVKCPVDLPQLAYPSKQSDAFLLIGQIKDMYRECQIRQWALVDYELKKQPTITKQIH